MIRGFSVFNANCFGFLRELIGRLDCPGSTWILDGQHVCSPDDWILDGSYSGYDLLRLIDETPNDCVSIIEQRFRMYQGEPDSKGIQTFEQFMQSNCDALIMCADGADFDVYLKDQDMSLRLFAAFSHTSERSEILTEEIDGRTGLSYLPENQANVYTKN